MKKAKFFLYYIYHTIKFIFVLASFIAVFSYLTFYYLVNHYFTRQEIKAIVSGHIQDKFMRPTTIDNVFFDLYGRMQIKGLKIYSTDRDKYLIVCPLITGKFSLYSIISSKIEIKNIKMISPEIFLRADENGKWKFEDIIEKWKSQKNMRNLTINSVSVEDGNIKIENKKQKLNHHFEKINFYADFSKDSSYSNFTISTDFDSAYFKAEKRSSFYLNADFMRADSLERCSFENITALLTLDDKIYSLKGEIKNLAMPHGDLIAQIPSTNLKKLISIKNEIYLPKTDVIIKFAFQPKLHTIDFNAYFEKLKASLRGYYSLLKNQKTAYDFTCKIKNLPAEKIKMILSPYIKNPSGFLDLDMRFFTKMNEKKWDIRSFFYDASFLDLENIARFSKIKGKLIINESFKALNILEGEAVAGKDNFKKITFKWESSGNLEKLSGSMYFNNKKTVFKGTIKNNETPKRNGEFSIYSQKADIKEISDLLTYIADSKKKAKLKKTSNKYDFTGKNLDIYFYSNDFENDYILAEKIFFQGNFSSFSADSNYMKGNFILKAEKGTFLDVQTNSEKNATYHLISLPLTTIYRMNRAGVFKLNSHIKNIDFSQVGADYSLNNGKMILRSFYIDGRDFMAHTTGEMDFTKEKIDLYVYVLNNKFNSMGGLPEALTDAKGRPALAFRLKGNFKNTTTKILDPNNNTEIIRKAIENGVNIHKSKFLFSEEKWQK